MKKRMLSTLLALCVALVLVPAASAAGLEDYQYFEFTNDPVGCYQITISGRVSPDAPRQGSGVYGLSAANRAPPQ